MAELPSPHSIAIGTLIALYSDVNSPLFTSRENENNRQIIPAVTVHWQLELSRLIQQLVMREEDGLFAFINPSLNGNGNGKSNDGDYNDSNNFPAAATAGNDGEDPNDVIDFDRHSSSSSSHNDLDMTDDFLKDLVLDNNTSFDDFSKLLQCNTKNNDNNGRKRSTNEDEIRTSTSSLLRFHASQHDTEQHSQQSSSSSSKAASPSCSFRIQTLSSLLDRIDDAFGNLSKSSGTTGNSSSSSSSSHHKHQQQAAKPRSPPSIALLTRLQTASSSIDDLMNLLDEWHALLDGSHIGYPLPGVVNKASLPSTAVTVGVDGESAFGIHLRKLCLGMEEIPFEAMSRLWMAFKSEVEDEAATSFGLTRCVTNKRSSSDNNNKSKKTYKNEQLFLPTTTTTNTTPDWLPSSPQIERLLRRTCLHPNLETYLRQERSSTIITSIMEELEQTHPECPSISFFLFLSSLAKGERTQALESLHRYFDYAMIHERKERAERAVMLQLTGGGASTGGGNTNNSNTLDAAAMRTSGIGGITTMASGMGGITGGMTGGVMNGMLANNNGRSGGGRGNNSHSDAKIYKESNVMEYAAVLLAQMHYRFGFSRLSLQATEEAVRVAQQSGDDECVSFANGWLALTSSSIGVGGIAKKSIHATVGGLASNATWDQSGSPSRGYRPLVPSANNYIGRSTLEEEAMLQHCQARASQRGLTSLSTGTSLELARRMMYRRDADGQLWSNESELLPSSTLAWNRIQRSSTGSSTSFANNNPNTGTSMLSNQTGDAALALGHTDVVNMTASDVIRTLGRQAMAESGLWDSTGHSSFASLSSCRALCGFWSNDALRRVLSSFSHGPYKEGNLYADTLERIASTPTSEWILSASAFVHEWSVRLYDISMARMFQNLIANHAAFPFNSLPPVETTLMLLTKSTHLFLQQEDYEGAKAAARQACWLSSRHALFFHLGLYLLQLSLIDLEASTSSPSNFESSLPPLLECLHLSEQYVMDPLRAMALSSLSRVFLRMGRICKARALLNAAIPLLMHHGHVWFQGEACLTLAKCFLAEISSRKTRASATQLRRNALVQLEKAATLFGKVDDIHRLKQVYYLQSRVYHFFSMSSGQKRNEAAENFFRLNKMKQHKLTGSKQWESIQGILITDINEMLRWNAS